MRETSELLRPEIENRGLTIKEKFSRRLPETQLKYLVGVLLTSFGVFFTAEGLGVHWPLSDLALVYVALAVAAISQARIVTLAEAR